MTNKEKYTNVFVQCFGVSAEQAETLKYQDVEAWDSIGHMNLIAELEDTFDIEIETDDIIDFSGYEKGIGIMSRYGVKIETD